MGEKLLRLMKSEGLTSSRLAEILGTGASNISHIISGRSKPGYDLLRKILLSFPQINPDWLHGRRCHISKISGSDPMRIDCVDGIRISGDIGFARGTGRLFGGCRFCRK